jgi:fructoselysine 6-kinase
MAAHLLTVGDNVVDTYPQQGLFYPGGNTVNVAVHVRRLGGTSSYIGAVGTDHAGQVVLGSMREEGVDTSRTRVIDGPNAYAVVHVVDGNRVFSPGDLGVSDFELTPEDLGFAGTFEIVHSGECSHLERQLPDLARAARRLSFDFSERDWAYIESLAPLVDIAIRSAPGSDRGAALEQARRLRDLGPRTVAVTLGAEGAVVLHGDDTWTDPAPPGPVVDTLGAGDAFIARLLLGLAREEPVADVVTAATAYATETCASFGAFGHPASLEASTTPAPHHDRLDAS